MAPDLIPSATEARRFNAGYTARSHDSDYTIRPRGNAALARAGVVDIASRVPLLARLAARLRLRFACLALGPGRVRERNARLGARDAPHTGPLVVALLVVIPAALARGFHALAGERSRIRGRRWRRQRR